MKQIELSVVVPCFNEEKNISDLVNRCLALFSKKEIAQYLEIHQRTYNVLVQDQVQQ